MKRLNLVNVMNAIESENATMAMLLDPDAFWNKDAVIDLQDAYDYYLTGVNMANESHMDLIEHCEKYGWDYSHLLGGYEKPMSFLEWLNEWVSETEKYIVS